MSTPAVSVVLPAYNAESSIAAAVGSILTQTVDDLELIVVDDGSVDGTASRLTAIRDPRLVVVHHPRNLGLTAALHTAISRATAPVIARMDADDTAERDRLARELALLRQRPEVGLVSSGFIAVDGQGREVGRHRPPPDHACAWFRLLFGNCLAHPTVMYRRSAYDVAGGYRAECYPADDHDLWLRMAEVTEIATIPDPLLRYGRADSAMSVRIQEAMDRASVAVSIAALERVTGRRTSEAALRAVRVDATPRRLRDRAAALPLVLAAYRAVAKRCRTRGIDTERLRGQLKAMLARIAR